MADTAQDILKKINYIEADMEIQKQILHAIPSAETREMEKVLRVIAGLKAEIETLRQEIKTVDPQEYQRIITFEKAADRFKQLAAEKDFKTITTFDGASPCTICLKDGSTVACLVKALDDAGDWTVITMEGEMCEFSGKTVMETTDDDTSSH